MVKKICKIFVDVQFSSIVWKFSSLDIEVQNWFSPGATAGKIRSESSILSIKILYAYTLGIQIESIAVSIFEDGLMKLTIQPQYLQILKRQCCLDLNRNDLFLSAQYFGKLVLTKIKFQCKMKFKFNLFLRVCRSFSVLIIFEGDGNFASWED